MKLKLCFLKDMNKKILLLSPCFTNSTGGIEAHVNALMALKVSDRVIVYRDGRFFNNETKREIPLTELKRIVVAYDVVWSHHPRILLRLRWLFPNKTLLNSSHGFIFHHSQSVLRRLYILAKLIIARFLAIKILCVSRNDYFFSRRLGAIYFPNFCRFNMEPVDQCGVSMRKGVILVGRYSKHKRIDKVRAFLSRAGFLQKLSIVCTSSDVSSYKKFFDGEFFLDISDTELASLYRQSRYFISMSDFEGFGLAAVEAIFMGCIPILASNGSYDALRDGGVIALKESDAEMLSCLDGNAEELHRIASLNQAKVLEFRSETFLDRLNDVLSEPNYDP